MHSTTNHPITKPRTRLRMAVLLLVMLAVGACVDLPQTPVSPLAVTPGAGTSGTVPITCSAPAPGRDAASQGSATPVIGEGSPADALTAERVTAAVWNMVACWNSGDYAALVALWTPNLLQNQFGISDVDAAQELLAGLPPLTVDSLGDVQTQGDGVASVDVVYRREVGQHMLVHERWYFVEQGEWYLLHELQPLPVALDGPYTEVNAGIREHAIELDQTTFAAGDALVFHVANDGAQPHEFAVFRTPSATSAAEIIAAGELPEGSAITGATFAFPGSQATDLVLVDLEPGTYIVVCNMQTPEGESHLPLGEAAEFTVEAP